MVMKNEERITQEKEKFSLADCFLADEDIRPPSVFQLTVFSEGIRPSWDITDREAFLDKLFEKINSLVWSPKERSLYREGFLNIDLNKSNGIFSCVYAKESALKIRLEKNLRIVEETYKTINASHKVKIEFIFTDNKDISITFYGGEEIFMAKARNNFIKSVRASFSGGFSQIPGNFDSEDMKRILDQFEVVEEIGISPGKSKKLKLFIRENQELVYEVHANYYGYKIEMAPAVKELLEEGEIKIRGIKGYLIHEKSRVKTVIASNGRVYFYFPGSHFDEESIFEAGNSLYRDLRLQERISKQEIIETFSPVAPESQDVGYVS